MRTIQEFLGHADSKTTQIYTHYAPSEHEVEMVNRAFTPRTAGNNSGNKLSETEKTQSKKALVISQSRTEQNGVRRAGGRAVAGSNPVSPISKRLAKAGLLFTVRRDPVGFRMGRRESFEERRAR
jgi:hypothetical protein